MKDVDGIKEMVRTLVGELKESFNAMEGRVSDSMKETNERLDTFVRTEITELKSILREDKK